MTSDVLLQVLDAARWAPSGDNFQTWHFEIVDDRRFVIHGWDTSEHCVYDLDGWASHLSLGALIETASVAASAHGLALQARTRPGMPPGRPTFDVLLEPREDVVRDPLVDVITVRAVQRRALSTRPLDDADRRRLEAAVGPAHELQWHVGPAERRRWAALLWSNAGLRLRLPEGFETHRSVIDWDAELSLDKMPAQSLGVDRMTQKLMRFCMQSPQRVAFLNDWLGGTVPPRVMMDLLPSLRCAGQVAILARQPVPGLEGAVAGGRAVQRFWLTAASLGLQHQPQMTPLIFRRYVVEQRRRFTAVDALQAQAEQLAARLDGMLEQQAHRAVWLGRIGYGPVATSRSIRKPLEQLLVKPATAGTGAGPGAGSHAAAPATPAHSPAAAERLAS